MKRQISNVFNAYKRTTTVLVVILLIFLIPMFKKIPQYYKNINKEKKEKTISVNKGQTVEDIVNKDNDGDGILNWEEGLWGTDPNKADSNDDGINDYQEITTRKAQLKPEKLSENNDKNLTRTDQLARELLIVSSALSQEGSLSQENADKIGAALAEKIQNPVIRKIYLETDLKIVKNDKLELEKYSKNIYNITDKNQGSDINIVFQKFIETNNASVLSELSTIINNMQEVIKRMVDINVPENMTELHLNFINGYQRLSENISDLQLIDIDPIVSLEAITKYQENAEKLKRAKKELFIKIQSL